MRAVIILTSIFFVGCAHNSNLQIVGSIYCESERPEGRAVAKVEVRYSPFESDQQSPRLASQRDGEAHQPINQAMRQVSESTPHTDTIKDWANLVRPFGAMSPSEPIINTESKLLSLCQTLLDK